MQVTTTCIHHKPAITFQQVIIRITLLLALVGCATKSNAPGPVDAGLSPEPAPPPEAAAPVVPEVLEAKTGLASYYHPWFNGRTTASGTVFNNNELTAAHPTYPFETLVRVTNLKKGEKAVEVRITDRGPTTENVEEGVIIDLSHEAAAQLGMLREGREQVKVEVLNWGK